MIAKPTLGGTSWIYALTLFGAALNAWVLVLTRQIERHDTSSTVMLYVALIGVIVSTPAASVEHWPAFSWALLAVVVPGPLGVFCGILAVRRANLSRLAPITYLRLPVAIVLGVALFGEVPDAAAAAGVVLILASNMLAWRRQEATA
jgi:drug/metabolite transporter (DMT)-like permease